MKQLYLRHNNRGF